MPRPASYSTQNIESEYCNHTAHMKRGYLMFGSWFSENCGYGQTVIKSKDCWDCSFLKNCELCFASVDCTQCNQILFSQNCSGCIDSAFLYDCRNCQNCLFPTICAIKTIMFSIRRFPKRNTKKIRHEMLGSRQALEKIFRIQKNIERKSHTQVHDRRKKLQRFGRLHL